jgi:hypothetical protein
MRNTHLPGPDKTVNFLSGRCPQHLSLRDTLGLSFADLGMLGNGGGAELCAAVRSREEVGILRRHLGFPRNRPNPDAERRKLDP